MIMNPIIFREYDIRGLVDRDLTPEVVRAIHRAYATFLKRRGLSQAIVGHDTRSYNRPVAEHAIQALLESGIDVIDIGAVTSPAFYFAQLYLKVTGGAMITASHNPTGWSGFKHLVAELQTATTTELKELQDIIAEQDFATGQGKYETNTTVLQAYADDLKGRFQLARPLTVLVDCGNESTSQINPDILRAVGCTVIEQDTTIGEPCAHEPNPSTLGALEHIREGVLANKADVGVGFDADGDRFGIVANDGEIIWADRIAMVIARQVLRDYPGSSIVFDVKCTQALVEEVQNDGGVPVMWKTGHSWIRRKGQEVDAAFAAERSGHFYFRRDHFGYDDGLYATLKLLDIIANQPNSLHELLADFPHYETSPVWHAPCADDVKYGVVDRLVEHFKQEYGADQVIDINGARVQFADGWGLVRASSNIPALVLVFEGKTTAARSRIEKLFRDLLQTYPEVGEHWESG